MSETTPNWNLSQVDDLAFQNLVLLSTEGRLAQDTAALHDQEGHPLFSETEQARRMEAIQATTDAAVAAAVTVADAELARARAVLEAQQGGDLGEALSDAEAQRAAARRAFVAEDCTTLPHAQVLARGRAVAAGADRAAQYLYHRFLTQRADAATEAARTQGHDNLQERQELGALIDDLAATLRGPDAPRAVAAAAARISTAVALRARANRLYDQAHGRAARVEAELRATGRYSM